MKVTTNVVIYALVAVLALTSALFLVVFVLGGPPEIVVTRAAIVSTTFVPVIGVLVALLQQGKIVESVNQTKDAINGHLAMHHDEIQPPPTAVKPEEVS
jgi:hypothetical protein